MKAMKLGLSSWQGALWISATFALMGCDLAPQDEAGATGALATAKDSQPDLVYGGRRFAWVKKAVYVARPPERPVEETASAAPNMSVEELANALRPRVLKDGHEYILAEPDLEMARQVLSGATRPETLGQDNAAPSDTGGVEQRQGNYIVGSDERARVGCARLNFPSKAKGHYATGCSATLIGPHTAAIAAHCVYNNGWFEIGAFTPAADTGDIGGCTDTQPFGAWAPTQIAIPGAWSSNQWDYDYAVLDFGAQTPGNTAGFVGTLTNPNGSIATRFEAYPSDKPFKQFWGQNGTNSCNGGCTTATRMNHNFDIIVGASGGGFIRTTNNQLYAIQSTQSYSCTFWSCSYWNTANRFTTAVWDFFHVFNWP